MSEVYSTPVHDSPEPQEVSVDTLAQEELAGMQSRLSNIQKAKSFNLDLLVCPDYLYPSMPELPLP